MPSDPKQVVAVEGRRSFFVDLATHREESKCGLIDTYEVVVLRERMTSMTWMVSYITLRYIDRLRVSGNLSSLSSG